MLKIYTLIAILGIIGTMGVTNTMVTYASNEDDDDENDNDPLNEACYRSGFNDAEQSHPYNQTAYSQCGVNDRAYYEGFISDVTWDRVWIIPHVSRSPNILLETR
ncbi:hypothetical protein [Candidatus Nitrosocosmicus arcticus]|uniref:Uncharacterized protein n=1 Tax=Candidatus Nitrosocosmicus arcticus TaxID=2035267 RepID=A0A557SZH9_9ARCH|nr:hypothetical protein [Candidatus Nitrosocosmicus arcticus]TVP41995.1 exported protein of unknown function [Candidatus Nitrosocosmicus arcticus]